MTRGQPIRRQALIVIAFMTFAVLILLRILGYAGVSVVPQPTYSINAIVPSAVQLIPHADVREAGIKVGQVTGINADGGDVRLVLAIDKRFGPVYANATVLIRAKSLAGENYVALDPGTRSAAIVAPNGTLPLTQAPESTQIDQVLAVLSAPRRHDLDRILAALGGGLSGRGYDLNELLDGTTGIVRNGLPVTEVVSSDRAAVASLISDFGTVSSGLAQRATGIQALAADARSLSTAVAARDGSLAATVRVLPALLSRAHSAVDSVGAFSRLADPVVANLSGAASELVPAMDALGPAALELHGALRALGNFDAPGRRLLQTLRRFAPVATTLMGPLETTMRQFNPALGYLKPFAQDIGDAISLIAAVGVYHDAVSHLLRGTLLVGSTSVAGTLSPTERALINSLLNSGALQSLTGGTGTNPYPAADLALKPWSGSYPRIQEDPPYSTRSSQ